MIDDQTGMARREEVTASASGGVWISKDNEVDEEIDRETRQFLNELQESKKNNRMIVGWRPD